MQQGLTANLHMEKAQEQPFEKESMEDLEAHMPIGGEEKSYRKANTKVTSKRLIQPSVFGIFNNKSKDKETKNMASKPANQVADKPQTEK